MSVRGQLGEAPVSLVLSRDSASAWIVNDGAVPALQGCIDVDLGFSPSTNLLPIRRLNLAIGASDAVRAAWVRFPELTVDVLEQRYTRLAESTYLYESAGGNFRRELTVNEHGFVTKRRRSARTKTDTATACCGASSACCPCPCPFFVPIFSC